MIDIVRTSGFGVVIANNLIAMLAELLKLRKKVRKDA
jgi:hypothetical protein